MVQMEANQVTDVERILRQRLGWLQEDEKIDFRRLHTFQWALVEVLVEKPECHSDVVRRG